MHVLSACRVAGTIPQLMHEAYIAKFKVCIAIKSYYCICYVMTHEHMHVYVIAICYTHI